MKFYTKKEYQKIADMYCLGKIQRLSYLHRGYQSPKVAVETPSGKFVISKNKLSNKKDIASKSQESLQYEIDMLKTVKGMPVPSFQLSSGGKFIEKVGDAWTTVYPFLPGKAPKVITTPMALDLGEFLGEFHKRSQKFKKNLKARRKFYDLNPRVMKIMDPYARQQTHPILKSVVEEIRRGVINNRPSPALPRGPIHVDIGPGNELFIGNKLSAIIDFGNFYIGPLMIDVGKTIMFNCRSGNKFDRKLLRKFIAGYASKRKLNREEKAYLKKSILYAIYSHIWVDLYHVPIKYVPESYTLFLVENFLPVAKDIEKSGI